MDSLLSTNFKQAMSECAHSVAVIVAYDKDTKTSSACTITGYSSVCAAEYPIMTFSFRSDSSTLNVIRNKRKDTNFTFNLLTQDQSEYSTKCATKNYTEDDFYLDSEKQIKYIPECKLVLNFSAESLVEVSSHSTLVIAKVNDVKFLQKEYHPSLIYVNRQYL